jgi:hypothetical protein
LGGAIFTVTDRGIARSAPHLSALALCLLSLSALGDAVQHGAVFCRQLVLIGANPRAAALAGGRLQQPSGNRHLGLIPPGETASTEARCAGLDPRFPLAKGVMIVRWGWDARSGSGTT